MKVLNLTIALISLAGLTSCSSIRNLPLKDSAASSTAPKKTTNSGKREFLNGMEVTPGGPVSDSKKGLIDGGLAAKKPAPAPKAENKSNTKPDIKTGDFVGIEHASMLQLKYAIATDATVEKLTNIPLLETIDKWWGTKYCMGGFTNECIDCSGFTQIVLRDVYQLSLPRTSQEQFAICEKVELEDLREGDLVFFNTTGNDVSHVGIYLLNNKFVHAATSGGVMISDLNEKYWQPKFRGAGRMSKQEEGKGSK
jgi:cell wall-associated NlpC family hydrolase